MTARTVSRAVVTPVAVSAQEVGRGVQAVSRTAATTATVVSRSATVASQSAAAASRSAGQMAAVTRATSAAAAGPHSVGAPAARRSAKKAGRVSDGGDLEILPATTLAKLTADQRNLMRASQKVAFESQVGEIISWNDSGRTGSTETESENKLGSHYCRMLLQKVVIDGVAEEGRVTACQDADGVWNTAF